ncbi:MAG: PIN domain-containing protein [Actinobacteria bacterium]|nr:PIN domain-containing protein [Actinomycetota bacterium]
MAAVDRRAALIALVDSNVLIRHLTGDPPEMARRATRFLSAGHRLLLTDLVVAEVVYVLSTFYGRPREEVAVAVKSLLALPSLAVSDLALLLRGIELFETLSIDFADAYLAAAAEVTGIGVVASFDRQRDRVGTVSRVEP